MKENRVEFRTSLKEKKQMEMAASLLGIDLSAFLRIAALEKSADIVKNETLLVLSNEDRDLFLAALDNPPKPNKALKKALLKYRKAHN